MLLSQARLHCAGIRVEGCDRRGCRLRHRELRYGEEQQSRADPCEEASLHAFEVAPLGRPAQCMQPQMGGRLFLTVQVAEETKLPGSSRLRESHGWRTASDRLNANMTEPRPSRC